MNAAYILQARNIAMKIRLLLLIGTIALSGCLAQSNSATAPDAFFGLRVQAPEAAQNPALYHHNKQEIQTGDLAANSRKLLWWNSWNNWGSNWGSGRTCWWWWQRCENQRCQCVVVDNNNYNNNGRRLLGKADFLQKCRRIKAVLATLPCGMCRSLHLAACSPPTLSNQSEVKPLFLTQTEFF